MNDVAVVGAGPAGALTAFLLARAGARVLLIDGSHPREKPCGGGVTGRALALVDEALSGQALPWVSVDQARFADTGVSPATVRLDVGHRARRPDLVVVSRLEFDRALVDAAVCAGAVHIEARVIDIDIDNGGAFVVMNGRRERVASIVGADGANSLVRRRVSSPFRRDQLSIAAGFFAHGASSASIDVKFTTQPDGYLWSFPRPDHLAIGACAPADVTSSEALRALSQGWMDEMQLPREARLTRYAWPIPSLQPRDVDTERPAGSRWLLVGDAAGLVDPITREGIYFALQSGALAADAMLRGNGHAGRIYEESLRREIYPELRRAALLKQGFFRGRFTRLLIEALHQSEGVRAVMRDLVAGRQPYATLKRRLLGTVEVRLALRLLPRRLPRVFSYLVQ